MEVSGQLHALGALSRNMQPSDSYSVGGWTGPSADLQAVQKRTISCLCRGSNSDFPFFQLVAFYLFFYFVSLGGVRLSPFGTSATVGLLYQPQMIDDYGAVGGMRIGRGNRSTRRKPAPVPLCTPQIPHDLTWDRTRAAAVRSQRLTA
jgi:hypothetical protein